MIIRTKTALISLISAIILAQSGYAITGAYDVKGRLTDSNGVNRTGIYSIRFSIFDAPENGNELWGRAINDINLRNGLFQVVLEGKDEAGRNFDKIVDKDVLYLEIKILSGPGIGGREGPLKPRQKLVGVPFAFAAGSVAAERSLRGIIAMWTGSAAEIPAGWCLCDGRACASPDGTEVTTPDLRGRFVLGTGAEAGLGAAGGSDDPFIDPPETQTSDIMPDYYADTEPGLDSGASKVRWHYVDIPPFQAGKEALYPKYYKVAFIMRL